MILTTSLTSSHYINKTNDRIDKTNKELKQTQEELEIQRDETKLVYSELDDAIQENQRLMSLKKYSPKELIRVVAEKEGINPILAVAISRLETANYTSGIYKENHNVGGMKKDGEWIKYDSLMEGVNAYILCLKRVYYNEGLTTPELIQPKYCPDNEGGQNWLKQVRNIMNEEG